MHRHDLVLIQQHEMIQHLHCHGIQYQVIIDVVAWHDMKYEYVRQLHVLLLLEAEQQLILRGMFRVLYEQQSEQDIIGK